MDSKFISYFKIIKQREKQLLIDYNFILDKIDNTSFRDTAITQITYHNGSKISLFIDFSVIREGDLLLLDKKKHLWIIMELEIQRNI